MFFILLMIFINSDGTKNIEAFPEVTQQSCIADAQSRVAAIQADRPPELDALGLMRVRGSAPA